MSAPIYKLFNFNYPVEHNAAALQPKDDRHSSLTLTGVEASFVFRPISVTQPAGRIFFCSFPRPIFVSLHASQKLSNFTGAQRETYVNHQAV
jgi:hypothetical protein